ncbi:MAG: hypothetical protein VKO21_07830 [Candidatus Sericytochromatia bacterium]|nr:hypothetical protein [Candidatus Sericytochromatia bacterium]
MIDHSGLPVLPATWEAGWQVWLRAGLWRLGVAAGDVGRDVRRRMLMDRLPDLSAVIRADWSAAFAGSDARQPWATADLSAAAGLLADLESSLLRLGAGVVPGAFASLLDVRWGDWPPAALAPRPAEVDPDGFVPLPVGEVGLPMAWPAALAAAGAPAAKVPGETWLGLLELAKGLRAARDGVGVLLPATQLQVGPAVRGVAGRLCHGLLASALPAAPLEDVREASRALDEAGADGRSALYGVLEGLREEPVSPWDVLSGAWLAFLTLRPMWTEEALRAPDPLTHLAVEADAFLALVRKSLETAALHRLLQEQAEEGDR